MMSILFVVLIFSDGMPILYIIGFLFFGGTFVVQKVLLLRFYKKSSSLTPAVWTHAQNFLIYSVFLHLICGFFMISNPSVVTINEDRVEDNDLLSMLNIFYEDSLPDFLASRLRHTYQVLYFIFLIAFITFYLAGNTIKSISTSVFSILGSCFGKLISGLREVFRIGLLTSLKKLCKKQKVETEKKIIQDHFSKRSLEKLGDVIKKRYNLVIVEENIGGQERGADEAAEDQHEDIYKIPDDEN